MKNLQNKNLTCAAVLTAVIFALQSIDVFLFKSNQTIFGDTIVARVLGLVSVLVACKIMKFNIGRRCLNGFGWFFEVIYGVGFALAPIVVIYAAELIYFRIEGFYRDLSISVIPPNGESHGLIVMLGVYAFALLINVVFKELYRGFLLNQLYPKLGKRKSNYIQSVIFTLLPLLAVLKAFIDGGFAGRSAADIIITVSASSAAVFVGSMRRGYCYRVNGSVWMAIADHFVNTLVMTCVYLSPDRLPDKWLLVKALVIQLISSAIFVPFYYRRSRVNDEYIKEMKTRREVLSALNESQTEPDEKTASNNYLMMLNETSQAKKFGGIQDTEILDLDREPKEFSKGVLEKSMDNTHGERHSGSGDGKHRRRSRSTENVPESAESISKLVDEYFKKQFDKNTFD